MQKKYIILYLLLALFAMSCGVVEKLANRAPVIKDIQASRYTILVGDTVSVSVIAEDPDEDDLTYSWSSNGGSFDRHNQASVVWKAPEIEDIYNLQVSVKDKNDGETKENLDITVISNSEPDVKITYPREGDYLVATQSIVVKATATPITYIDKVDFYISDQFVGSDKTTPFSFDWSLDNYSGSVEIKAIAYRSIPSSIRSADSLTVLVQGVVPIP